MPTNHLDPTFGTSLLIWLMAMIALAVGVLTIRNYLSPKPTPPTGESLAKGEQRFTHLERRVGVLESHEEKRSSNELTAAQKMGQMSAKLDETNAAVIRLQANMEKRLEHIDERMDRLIALCMPAKK